MKRYYSLLLVIAVMVLTGCKGNENDSLQLEENAVAVENNETLKETNSSSKYMLEIPEEREIEITEETYTYEQLEESLQSIAKEVREKKLTK